MNILAVIPARAKSKGIPNKNIRLINDKPLIYYAIMNALKSEYINEIVISTDSPEVEIIAKQMGVGVHIRDASLCGDDVTLDSVIYDLASKKRSDYIITLQPTSPTLQYVTLDKAIQYTIENELDTVISCINQPHLAWIENDAGEKVPAYLQRMNRQYLPPYYLETGAFIISKASVVTAQTRIGKKVDVYPLSDDEAIDIDSFADMRHCEEIIKGQTVAFYVNGSTRRGMGHIYRCLELADEFFVKPDIYYDINQTDVKLFGETTHTLMGINGLNELLTILDKKKYDIFINDILNTTIDYMIALKKCNPAKKIINFEDDGEGAELADLVINALYQNPVIKQMKAGKDYYVCAKTFMFYEPIKISNQVKQVFISFGGADPQNYTDRLLDIVSKEKYYDIQFNVVIGRAKQNIDHLIEYNNFKNINVYFDIKNMPEIMSNCDIAITSRGRTGYELAILGIPTIAMAQNQREEKHGFVCEKNGFKYLGLNPNDDIIETTLDNYINLTNERRTQIQAQLLSHNLRDGRKRVISLINSL